jgi:hypothetical protein
LVRAVENADQIIAAITTPPEKRRKLQSTICGLERFLLFCGDLKRVIDAFEGRPSLQTAAFQLYQYWFRVRGDNLGLKMRKALSALKMLEDGAAHGDVEHSVSQL